MDSDANEIILPFEMSEKEPHIKYASDSGDQSNSYWPMAKRCRLRFRK
jgi:hypothetical protein